MDSKVGKSIDLLFAKSIFDVLNIIKNAKITLY